MSDRPPAFGHPSTLLASWRRRVRQALRRGAQTPFFLFAAEPVADAHARLERLRFGRPLRGWFSGKTHPLPAMWRWWRQRQGSLEVVSEWEFRTARNAGFDADHLLVNGPAKHRWLPRLAMARQRVNFDSPGELAALLAQARRQRWRTGLRLRTPVEVDPEHPDRPSQFGMEPSELAAAVGTLRSAGLEPEVLHFHLRTHLPKPSVLARAMESAAAVCEAAGWHPPYLNAGGGLAPPFTLDLFGRRFDADLSPREYATVLREGWERMPFVRELWMEHGRYVCAGGGVLALRILEARHRDGARQWICDGGRTLHALVSTWEQHALIALEPRGGRRVMTSVHGPTCMAFDTLARLPMASSLRPGDVLIWLDAGAYHLSWETRFSHDLAEVWWEAEGRLRRVRRTAAH
ncbi:MAG: hypothetical protein KIT22_08525 [Verrucomicrobiae bacterium]|nr:hypothetical protein [Verrucomicrobiae bacterium]